MGGKKDPRNPSKHDLWNTWKGVLARCYYEKHPSYHNYGGRGITVCDAWRNDFWAFVQEVGLRGAGLTLDRIDSNGNYEPGNVRWTTWKVQNNNRRDTSQPFTLFGQATTIREVAKRYNLSVAVVKRRVAAKLPDDEVILTVEQARKQIIYKGERHTTISLAELAGVTREAMRRRLLNMSPEEAVSMEKKVT